MNASIITIGDEILIGQVLDTNSQNIARKLNHLGMKTETIISCSDNETAIVESLDFTLKKSDIVFITGGLGPTNDDITKKVLCKFFDTALYLDKDLLEKLTMRYRKIGVEVTESNKNQALLPKNAKIFTNEIGSAQGMMFEKNDKIIFSLPGVPAEMIHVFDNEIFPFLKSKYHNNKILHKTLLVVNLPESILSEKIKACENSLPDYLKLAYLPSYGYVKLRLSCYSLDDEKQKILDEKLKELTEIISEHIISEEDVLLEDLLGNLLTENHFTLSTAESCTGGALAAKITSVPGSSAYYKGSIISYANEIKQKFLNVSEEDIKKHGAVSQQVVEQMARYVRQTMQTDFSIATSGIAGPSGGTEEKSVGTTWIAIAMKNKVVSKKFQFSSNRANNILRTVNVGITSLILELKKLY